MTRIVCHLPGASCCLSTAKDYGQRAEAGSSGMEKDEKKFPCFSNRGVKPNTNKSNNMAKLAREAIRHFQKMGEVSQECLLSVGT